MERTLNVISFVKVIPAKNKSQEKIDILNKFIKGVNATGDNGIVSDSLQMQSCDIAMIQGWQHEHGKTAPHLKLRQQIIDTQINTGKIVCTADANLFLYANKTNQPHHYLRYSFNGVFPNTGVYFDNKIDPMRWKQISKDLNISIEDKKSKGSNILICLQRNGGWSLGKKDVVDWTVETVQNIRKFSDRPIVIRPHPGDKRAYVYLSKLETKYEFQNSVSISYSKSLEEDLLNSWAVVNHNSSSIVGPLIQGYPAFITDPATSQCAEVSHVGFENIENPQEFDRQQWLERISMFHWKFSELEDGTAWRHMRQFV
jgi:hypothetical protein